MVFQMKTLFIQSQLFILSKFIAPQRCPNAVFSQEGELMDLVSSSINKCSMFFYLCLISLLTSRYVVTKYRRYETFSSTPSGPVFISPSLFYPPRLYNFSRLLRLLVG